MSNPYASPADPNQYSGGPYYAPPIDPTGLISHVRVLAILNAVQGGLEMLMGLLYSSMAVVVPLMMSMDPNIQKRPDAPPKEMFWIMSALYLAMGTPVWVAGLLRIVAGIRNFSFKGRIMGIVSIILGMGSLLSCYCFPTAVALLIYGLIVYLNPPVMAAFQMGQQGKKFSEILAAFYDYGPPKPPDQMGLLDKPPHLS